MVHLVIILSITCSASAQLFLKKGMGQLHFDHIPMQLANIGAITAHLVSNVYILAGVFLQFMALVTWLFVLKRVDVSYAYPFISLGFVFVLFASHFLFQEEITAYRMLGIGTISLGIFLISRG